MTPTVRTEDLADAQERRYPDMPRPVVDLGPGRPKLWLRPHIRAWAAARRHR
jgi:glutathione-regulated potassium-efflux system ancillary protein KefG